MEYTDLQKKNAAELVDLLAQNEKELMELRFSISEKNTKKALALRQTISRIQTALRNA